MNDTIFMRHPTLPEDQEIEVPREAMPHYTSAGWQLVPAEELEKRAELKAKAAAEEQTEPADEPEKSEPAEPTERPARSRAKAHEKKTEEN